MINPENPMSQNKNGSPAQIWTYDFDLAEVIFGSLEEARIYGEKCDELATRSCAAEGLPEVHVLSARGAIASSKATRYTPTHQHTQTQNDLDDH